MNLRISWLLATTALSVPAFAQNVLFAETFTAGIPATWAHQTLGSPVDVWAPGVDPITNNPDVFHEWFCFSGAHFRNNILVTPRIDLTGLAQVEFQCKQHQTFPLQRVLNRIEVTTNGGATFTPLYTETGTWSGPGSITLDLSAYAGMPDVRIGFHYQGAIANEWRIDDVQVTTRQSLLSISGNIAGAPTTYSIAGAEPVSIVLLGLSIDGAGPLPTPFGIVHLTPTIFLVGPMITDAGGSSSLTATYPPSAAGYTIYAHAVNWMSTGLLQLSSSRSVTLL